MSQAQVPEYDVAAMHEHARMLAAALPVFTPQQLARSAALAAELDRLPLPAERDSA